MSNLGPKLGIEPTGTSLGEETVDVSIPDTRAERAPELSQKWGETSRVTCFRTTLVVWLIGVRLLASAPPGGLGLVRST